MEEFIGVIVGGIIILLLAQQFLAWLLAFSAARFVIFLVLSTGPAIVSLWNQGGISKIPRKPWYMIEIIVYALLVVKWVSGSIDFSKSYTGNLIFFLLFFLLFHLVIIIISDKKNKDYLQLYAAVSPFFMTGVSVIFFGVGEYKDIFSNEVTVERVLLIVLVPLAISLVLFSIFLALKFFVMKIIKFTRIVFSFIFKKIPLPPSEQWESGMNIPPEKIVRISPQFILISSVFFLILLSFFVFNPVSFLFNKYINRSDEWLIYNDYSITPVTMASLGNFKIPRTVKNKVLKVLPQKQAKPDNLNSLSDDFDIKDKRAVKPLNELTKKYKKDKHTGLKVDKNTDFLKMFDQYGKKKSSGIDNKSLDDILKMRNKLINPEVKWENINKLKYNKLKISEDDLSKPL